MTAKNHDSIATIKNETDSIWVHAESALLWKFKPTNEYTLLHGRAGKAIKLTAQELTDLAHVIAAMTKAQDGEL